MSDIAEIIAHLSRHEGGALGRSPVVVDIGDGVVIRTGRSVDEALAGLRALAARRPGVPANAVAVTANGRNMRLDRVLGYHLPTGRVVIEGSEVTP